MKSLLSFVGLLVFASASYSQNHQLVLVPVLNKVIRNIMKSYSLLFILFFSHALLARSNETFCIEKVDLTGAIYVKCDSNTQSNENDLVFKIDYKAGHMPEKLRSQVHENFLQEARRQDYSCIYRIRLMNDNQQMLGRNSSEFLERQKYGDDFGNTHAFDGAIGCMTKDKISTTLSYSTDLFTAPIYSSYRVDQNEIAHLKTRFVSENIFSIIQDNINQGKVSYWKAGFGFINLSEKYKWNLGQSTGQQAWFHHVINSINNNSAYEYEYIEGKNDSWGAFILLVAGLQEYKKLNDRMYLSVSVDIGGRASTLSKTSTLNATLNTKLVYQVSSNHSIYLRGKFLATKYINNDRIEESSIALGIDSKKGYNSELGVAKQHGNRTNVYDIPNPFTGKNDLLIYLEVAYKH